MILVSLGSARDKARMSAGKGTLSGVPAAIAICIDFQGTVQPPIQGENVCSITQAQATWPYLPEGWKYGQVSNGNTEQVSVTASCDSTSCGENITYTCTLTGCK